MLFIQIYDCDNVPLHPKVMLRDPIEFTFPSDMYTVMSILILVSISIPFTAVSKSFCVLQIHCPFRCTVFIEIPSRFPLCLPIAAPYGV